MHLENEPIGLHLGEHSSMKSLYADDIINIDGQRYTKVLVRGFANLAMYQWIRVQNLPNSNR